MYGSKNERARIVTVFSPKSEVSTRAAKLKDIFMKIFLHGKKTKTSYFTCSEDIHKKTQLLVGADSCAIRSLAF